MKTRIIFSFLALLAFAGCGGGANPNKPADRAATTIDSAEKPIEGATAAPAAEGKPAAPAASFPDGTTLSLLSDRLGLRMPKGARIEARPHSIMAADQPNEQETRVMLDAGDERLVIMTYETFERIPQGKDPDAAVRAAVASEFGSPAPAVSKLPVADSALQVWLAAPASVDRNREAILVLAAYVLHADGFVQTLSFYVNPAAAKGAGCAGQIRAANVTIPDGPGELSGCSGLAHAITHTLTAGKRRLDVGAGERKLQGQYNDDTLIANVPAGTNVTTQKGPDFTVHFVRLPVELGAPPASLGIYIGGHPSFQYKQVDAQVKPTSKPGKAFGKAVSWQVWPVGPTRAMAEVMVPHPKSKGLTLHLFASGADEKALSPLLDIAATLSVP